MFQLQKNFALFYCIILLLPSCCSKQYNHKPPTPKELARFPTKAVDLKVPENVKEIMKNEKFAAEFTDIVNILHSKVITASNLK